MAWLAAAAAVLLVVIGVLEVWRRRAAHRAAAGWLAAQRAVAASPLPDRRPQDDLEGWR